MEILTFTWSGTENLYMLTKHKKTSGQGNRTKVITRRRPPKIVASENLSTRLQEGIMAMSSILLLLRGKS